MIGNRKPIGVFDSGIGGLTVVREMVREMPGERILYLGDTARYPYGPRSKEAIQRMAAECVGHLVRRGVKMVVIACNTATAHAFEHLQKKYSHIPFVGVIEPCTAAVADHMRKGRVGIIGTEATIACNIYADKIKQLRPNIDTISSACPLLVPLAEEGILDGPIVEAVLERYLKPFRKKGLRALILACTHYPFFRKRIEDYFKGKVFVLDSATWTAQTARLTLEMNFMATDIERTDMNSHRFMVTDFPEKFKRLGGQFLGETMTQVESITIKK
ncbi:MAG: glutamate racemase [Elusimicrobia bacterium RIFOXYB2_FULL_49_7]|nr:MAG: glutamate racemase [Elusimicrobia bacterium RIFOXYB2_FULL_49_7]